jgi:hypothetical protein
MSVTLGHFESRSTRGKYYDVLLNDDGTLSCNCPAWTQSTHFADCPQHRGDKCTCRSSLALTNQIRTGARKDTRTCPHLRDVLVEAQLAGGLSALADRGIGPSGRAWPSGIAQALRDEQAETRTRVPVDTGALRRSIDTLSAGELREQERARRRETDARRRMSANAQRLAPAPEPPPSVAPNTRAMRIRDDDD